MSRWLALLDNIVVFQLPYSVNPHDSCPNSQVLSALSISQSLSSKSKASRSQHPIVGSACRSWNQYAIHIGLRESQLVCSAMLRLETASSHRQQPIIRIPVRIYLPIVP